MLLAAGGRGQGAAPQRAGRPGTRHHVARVCAAELEGPAVGGCFVGVPVSHALAEAERAQLGTSWKSGEGRGYDL